jgi:putative colanic acid biosynthesis UDP-glucose lipid carrier transferase
MISDRTKGVQNLVLLCQCLLVTAAFWVWFFLCYDLPVDPARVNHHLIYNLFVLLGIVVGARTLRTDLFLRLPGADETTRRTVRQLGFTLFYLLLYLVAVQSTQISRVFLFSFLPLLFLILFITNRVLPPKIGKLSYYKDTREQVILLGPGRKAAQLRDWLLGNQHLGMEIKGLLTDDPPETVGADLPLLGKLDELDRVLGAPGITKVIMVQFPRNADIRRYTDICEAHGSRLLVVADLDEIFGHSVAVYEDSGTFFLGLREEPLEDPINRVLKRCLDIAVSLPVVVFALPPLMLFVWLAQRIQSPGPLFYWQNREGIYNEPFAMLKFRSMHVGNKSDTRLPTSKDDPRLYPIGSFLRKTSLDEFPQFWNVLCGTMSVVGPRPHLKSYNDQYHRVCLRAYVRALVKPGVTGLAQARGYRGDAKTPDEVVHRIESDIEYLENWTLWLDFWLVIRTALQIIKPPKGAV